MDKMYKNDENCSSEFELHIWSVFAMTPNGSYYKRFKV